MVAPNIPRYISPKERAENRARIRAFVIWSAAGTVAVFILMLFAYTDQAPGWMREAAFQLDSLFGFPVLQLIKMIAAR